MLQILHIALVASSNLSKSRTGNKVLSHISQKIQKFSETTRLTLTGDRASYPGGRAAYSCFGGVGVQWLVNGTGVEDLNLGDDVVVEFSEAREEGNLLFRNIPPEYNETTIQCRANYSSGTSSTSDTVTLLLQG